MNDFSLFERVKEMGKSQPFHLVNESNTKRINLNDLVLMPNQFAYSIDCEKAELEEVIGNVKFLNLTKRDFTSIDLFYERVYAKDLSIYINTTLKNFEFMLGNAERCTPLRNSFSIAYRLKKVRGAYEYVRRETFASDSCEGIVNKTIGIISLLPNVSLSDLKPVVHGADSLYYECEEVKYFESILSPRELQLVKLIALGYSTRQCAQQLFISTRTVETHRKNILKKLEAKNTPHLVYLAGQMGLI